MPAWSGAVDRGHLVHEGVHRGRPSGEVQGSDRTKNTPKSAKVKKNLDFDSARERIPVYICEVGRLYGGSIVIFHVQQQLTVASHTVRRKKEVCFYRGARR